MINHRNISFRILLISFFVFAISAHLKASNVNDSLIVNYTFDKSNKDTVFDVSGHKNFGLLKGSASLQNAYAGNGVNLPAVTDYLQLPNGLINSLTSFTVSAWVMVNSNNAWSRIFDFGTGTPYNMFLTPFSGAGNLRFAIKNNGGEEQLNAPVAVPVGVWTHVAVTFEWPKGATTGTGKLYMNGILQDVNTNFSINPSMLPLSTQNYIGKSQYPDPGLNGMVDNFRMYNRALGTDEIMQDNGLPASLVDAYNQLFIPGNLNAVKTNLTLPAVAGKDSLPVTWTSAFPNIISIKGVVVRPERIDANVKLTATISMVDSGTIYSINKDFTANVVAKVSDREHWESMVVESDVWRFNDAYGEPPAGWMNEIFDDSKWNYGNGGIGMGDNDDNTLIRGCNSLYLRRKVTIPDNLTIENVVLDIDYDDAFVLYLNGVECARSSNLKDKIPVFNSLLTSEHEAKMYKGGNPERFQLSPSKLKKGINTVAVQVINSSNISDDLSSRIFLQLKLISDSVIFHPVPVWFTEPNTVGISNLPLVMINTNGQQIVQNSKITADMRTLNDSSGINFITDTTFQYKGKIGIEVRGFSSSGFPKRSYTVETRTDSLTNQNVKLLGLHKENDWIFHGPYPDKSLMRNALAYYLGNQTGRWSPKTKFFELYLNDAYQGVYALVEKIKVDKNRCNIAKISPADTTGDALTGGYILKLDRPEATDVNNVNYWISPYKAWTAHQQNEYFIFQDPDGTELNPKQRQYIQNYVTKFEDAMNSRNYTDRVKGYLPYINLTSFVDYYIINELSRNLDGYRVSTFLHKDRDSNGGKITMGPFWDYDITFGNANFFSAGDTKGWIIDGMGNADAYAMPFWWQKLRLDPYFNAQLKRRWNDLNKTFLNTSAINQVIDSFAYVLRDAQKRNFTTWNILNTFVWPNNYISGSYSNEINYLKTWIKDRMAWMDSQIQPIVDITVDNQTPEFLPMDLIAYPNPFTDELKFKFYITDQALVKIEMYDILGKKVFEDAQNYTAGINLLPVNIHQIASESKVFIYKVIVDGQLQSTGKLIRQE